MSLEEWAYRWATTPPSERINVWRAHRIDEILAGRAPRPLDKKPTLVLHIFPDTAFNNNAALPQIQRDLFAGAAGLATSDGRIRSNADGITAYGQTEQTYAQIFRDSVVEYVSTYVLHVPGEQEIDGESLTAFLEQFLLTIPRCFGWGNEDRAYALTLLHINGHRFVGAKKHLGFDRDNILFPLVTAKQPIDAVKTLQQLLIEAHGQG
jgi:hypothetical protein